eukprot:1804160-Pyramimonas_sp.AAC.1
MCSHCGGLKELRKISAGSRNSWGGAPPHESCKTRAHPGRGPSASPAAPAIPAGRGKGKGW